ncbi:hypothetical protein FF38_04707 [Lucilia cuprina]|uniref:Uncharacterized protein n=1 Tax=Lucilia cuprina TaxID=7375 RepID=A0A0L0CLC6_LUCCU|nr:hypothetical protein FF38_04707 [Lucilia cuprina]
MVLMMSNENPADIRQNTKLTYRLNSRIDYRVYAYVVIHYSFHFIPWHPYDDDYTISQITTIAQKKQYINA